MSTHDAAELDDAVNRAEIDEVRRILDRGVDPNIRDITGDPIIVSAAWVGAADIVELLLARGADANAAGQDGKNALQRLLSDNQGYWYEGHDHVVAILRAAGARE